MNKRAVCSCKGRGLLSTATTETNVGSFGQKRRVGAIIENLGNSLHRLKRKFDQGRVGRNGDSSRGLRSKSLWIHVLATELPHLCLSSSLWAKCDDPCSPPTSSQLPAPVPGPAPSHLVVKCTGREREERGRGSSRTGMSS